MQDATNILAEKDAQAQLEEEKRGRTRCSAAGLRRCGNCGKTGHNSRTWQGGAKIYEEPDCE